MTCMDIIKQLNPSDRAECWKLFTGLTRVFMLKHSKGAVSVNDLRLNASQMNMIFEKNGYDPYFDLNVDNSFFINNLLVEMQKIKKLPKESD